LFDDGLTKTASSRSQANAGKGKSRLAQAEMLGVFVPGANQGSEVRFADGVEKALSEA
jgi:hypothetical protein